MFEIEKVNKNIIVNNCDRLKSNDICNDCNFNSSNFIDCNLKNRNYDGSFFESCIFNKVKFENFEMNHIEFDQLEFTNSIFKNCNFKGSDFIYNRLENVTFENCDFSNGEWRNVNLYSCNFINCNFTNTTITLCQFSSCNIDQKTLQTLKGIEKNYNVFTKDENIQCVYNNNIVHININQLQLNKFLEAIEILINSDTIKKMEIDFIILVLKNLSPYLSILQLYYLSYNINKILSNQNEINNYFSEFVSLIAFLNKTAHQRRIKLIQSNEKIIDENSKIEIIFEKHLTKDDVNLFLEIVNNYSNIQLELKKIEYGSTIVEAVLVNIAEITTIIMAIGSLVKSINHTINEINRLNKNINRLLLANENKYNVSKASETFNIPENIVKIINNNNIDNMINKNYGDVHVNITIKY